MKAEKVVELAQIGGDIRLPVDGMGCELARELEHAFCLPEGSEMERFWKSAKLAEVRTEITKLLKALTKKSDQPSLPIGE